MRKMDIGPFIWVGVLNHYSKASRNLTNRGASMYGLFNNAIIGVLLMGSLDPTGNKRQMQQRKWISTSKLLVKHIQI